MADNKLLNRFELKRRSKGLKKHARKAEGATVRHARRFVVNRWENIREVRIRVIVWLGCVGLLIAIVGLQMMWFQRSYIMSAPVAGGTYAEAVRGPIDTLDPLYATTPAEVSASRLLFSSLFNFDATGHLKGDLARSMTIENNKVFTVTLRSDARWHDGQPVKAADVIFTVDLMKNPAARSVMHASWRGIEAKEIDEQTVQFTLPASLAVFPQALTFSIVPQHLLKNVEPGNLRESAFSTAPVGSGAFTLKLLQTVNETTGRKIVHVAANRDYYAGTPRLDRLQLHAYHDDESVARALRTGEVSAASDIPSNLANAIDKDRYDIVAKPTNSGVYAFFNVGQPLLKDPAVRRALQLSTNTAAIREQLYDTPEAMDLPFAKRQVPGSETLVAPAYDKVAAAKLLTDNGWAMQGNVRVKGEEKLQLRIVTRKNSEYEKTLELLSGQWRDLGVDVQTQVVDTADATQSFAQQVLQQRGYDVLLDELMIGADPDVFYFWHSRGQLNVSNYSNQVSDDALASARTTTDSALRSLKYLAFARQWLEDVPAIGLYQSDYIYAQIKGASTIRPDEIIVEPNEHYANVRYWTAERGSLYKTP